MNNVIDENTELIQLVSTGATASVEELLNDGGNANARNRDGETVLHIAANAGQVETVACLLINGADYNAINEQGQTALDPAVIGIETLHSIRQHFHRYRGDRDRSTALRTVQMDEWAGQLDRQGITCLSGLLKTDDLQKLQQDFSRFVSALNARILRREALFERYDDEEHFWPRDRAYVSNNAFKHSSVLARFCSHPDLLDIIQAYIGMPPLITRGVAMRYLPDVAKDRDMFGWHHDLEDRRLKLQILLTDVGPEDQHMSYVCGSHSLYHPYEMFLDNRCGLDYCREKLGAIEVFKALGRAGDVFLFDSNGAHRGNRRPGGAVRDAFFVEYSGDCSDIWGGDIPPGALDDMNFQGENPFRFFIDAEKKWEQPITRQSPTWVENLPNISSWLETN